jgi:hypothetical protein
MTTNFRASSQANTSNSIFKGIVIILFVLSTVFLTVKTWQIQHSCQPMIGCASPKLQCSEDQDKGFFCKITPKKFWENVKLPKLPSLNVKIPLVNKN